jgi:hypothetical protein
MVTSETRNAPSPVEVISGKSELLPVFRKKTYELKRRLFRFRTTFDLSDDQGKSLMRAEKEILHLKRKFHLYEGKKGEKELLSFQTRGGPPETYDVQEGTKRLGTIQHNLSESIPRTHWDIFSADGERIGTLRQMKLSKETQRYGRKSVFHHSYEIVTADEKEEVIASMLGKFSPLGIKFRMDINENDSPIDRRLLVAANVIIAERAFERKKDGQHSSAAS